jgi:uncharacterized protein YjiS (DUF1127 family)
MTDRSIQIAVSNRAGSRPGLVRRLVTAFELRRQREALAGLDSHLLEDLGLTPDDVRREVASSDWDAPRSWFR